MTEANKTAVEMFTQSQRDIKQVKFSEMPVLKFPRGFYKDVRDFDERLHEQYGGFTEPGSWSVMPVINGFGAVKNLALTAICACLFHLWKGIPPDHVKVATDVNQLIALANEWNTKHPQGVGNNLNAVTGYSEFVNKGENMKFSFGFLSAKKIDKFAEDNVLVKAPLANQLISDTELPPTDIQRNEANVLTEQKRKGDRSHKRKPGWVSAKSMEKKYRIRPFVIRELIYIKIVTGEIHGSLIDVDEMSLQAFCKRPLHEQKAVARQASFACRTGDIPVLQELASGKGKGFSADDVAAAFGHSRGIFEKQLAISAKRLIPSDRRRRLTAISTIILDEAALVELATPLLRDQKDREILTRMLEVIREANGQPCTDLAEKQSVPISTGITAGTGEPCIAYKAKISGLVCEIERLGGADELRMVERWLQGQVALLREEASCWVNHAGLPGLTDKVCDAHQ